MGRVLSGIRDHVNGALGDETVVRHHHDQVVSRPTDSPSQQESVIPEGIVPEVNNPEATHGDIEMPRKCPDSGPPPPPQPLLYEDTQ